MTQENYKMNILNLFRLDENKNNRGAKIGGMLFAAVAPEEKSKKDIDFIKANGFVFLYKLDLWDIYSDESNRKVLLKALISKGIIAPVETRENIGRNK